MYNIDPFKSIVIPNFLGIGAAKAGTTKLTELLSQHPEVSIPIRKELHFFDDDDLTGKKNIEWYFSQFEDNIAVGEYTPSYLFVPDCAKKIYETFGGKMKFIVSLRNPIDRAYSHYCHAITNWGKNQYRKLNYPIENLSFEKAIQQEDIRLKSCKFHIRHLSYFSKGLYDIQLKRYFKLFCKSNFFIYTLEEFIEKPEYILKKLCRFLNVFEDFKFKAIDKKKNSQTIGTLSEQQRLFLYNKYRKSIENLELLIDKDLSCWKA